MCIRDSLSKVISQLETKEKSGFWETWVKDFKELMREMPGFLQKGIDGADPLDYLPERKQNTSKLTEDLSLEQDYQIKQVKKNYSKTFEDPENLQKEYLKAVWADHRFRYPTLVRKEMARQKPFLRLSLIHI